MEKSISILGSLNMDIVLSVEHLPDCGETILANNVKKGFGGKGANQAVAAARLGNSVFMIGKVGNDEYGSMMREALSKDGINTDFLFSDNLNSTGTAYILVDSKGNNSIIVDSGSNMALNQDEFESVNSIIKKSNIIIAQFETPIQITIEAFKRAKEYEVCTILNPAPARNIPSELLGYTDIIIPNETEIEILTGIKVEDECSAKKAAEKLLKNGCKFVVITLGDKGAVAISSSDYKQIPAFKTTAVDTTAAGDGFIGAFATKLLEFDKLDFESIVKAVEFGNLVSSIAVQRHGAQPSLPYKEEVADYIKG